MKGKVRVAVLSRCRGLRLPTHNQRQAVSAICLHNTVEDDDLARNFSHLSPAAPTTFTHLDRGGEKVRVKLEERLGKLLWVRPLDSDEPLRRFATLR